MREVSGAHLRSANEDETAADESVLPDDSEKAEAEEKDAWNAYEKKKLAYEKTYEKQALAFHNTFEEKKLAFGKKVGALNEAERIKAEKPEETAQMKAVKAEIKKEIVEKAKTKSPTEIANEKAKAQVVETFAYTAGGLKEFGEEDLVRIHNVRLERVHDLEAEKTKAEKPEETAKMKLVKAAKAQIKKELVEKAKTKSPMEIANEKAKPQVVETFAHTTPDLKEFSEEEISEEENSASEKTAEEKVEERNQALHEAEAAEKKSNENLGAAKVAADTAKTKFSGMLRKLAAAAGAAANKAAIEKAEKAVMEKSAEEKEYKKTEALNDVEAELKKITEKAESAMIAAEKAKAELAAAEKAKANSAEKADAQAQKAKVAKAKAEKFSSNL